ncbi:hypothetical protein LTR10_021983 [Elasticomyces elasticus]|nr:hypothetical protein LTR10_021983 [Elasticomyces elasticus]
MAQLSSAESDRVLKEIIQRRISLDRSVICYTRPMMHQLALLKDTKLTAFLHNSHNHEMCVLQQPLVGRVVQPAEKSKSAKSPEAGGRQEKPRANPRNRTLPLDPPAVVRYVCHDNDLKATWMDSPHTFCTVTIWSCDPETKEPIAEEDMKILKDSVTASSLQRVPKGNKEHPSHWGVFAFPDILVHKAGLYHLKFSLWEMRRSGDKTFAYPLSSKFTDKPINVEKSTKQLPLGKSTALTHELYEAGIKVRIRKEPSKRKTQTQDWRTVPQKNSTAGALPIGMPNGVMGVPSTNGEDITGRLNYRRGSQDHGIQAPYGHAPLYGDCVLPTNTQALVDPVQTLYSFGLGMSLAEMGQGQYLGIQNTPYTSPTQYVGFPYNENGQGKVSGHDAYQQYFDANRPQFTFNPLDNNAQSHPNGHAGYPPYFDTHQRTYSGNSSDDSGPSHPDGHAGHQPYLTSNQPQYASVVATNNGASHPIGHAEHQSFSDSSQPQYASVPATNNSASRRTGHAEHQSHLDTRQPQYASVPAISNGGSRRTGYAERQSYFDTSQPQYASVPDTNTGASRRTGHAEHQSYLDTSQPQYASVPATNNGPSPRTSQDSQQPFIPAMDTFSFTAPTHSVSHGTHPEEPFALDPFDPPNWPMMGPNGMPWPSPPPPPPPRR